MSKISISLEDELEQDLDNMVLTHPNLTKRNHSIAFADGLPRSQFMNIAIKAVWQLTP